MCKVCAPVLHTRWDSNSADTHVDTADDDESAADSNVDAAVDDDSAFDTNIDDAFEH